MESSRTYSVAATHSELVIETNNYLSTVNGVFTSIFTRHRTACEGAG